MAVAIAVYNGNHLGARRESTGIGANETVDQPRHQLATGNVRDEFGRTTFSGTSTPLLVDAQPYPRSPSSLRF